MGSHAPANRELDGETVARSRVICDSVEACWAEAGDLIIPEQDALIDRSHARVGLGDVLLTRAAGRTSSNEVTVFKSVGLAFQDLWSAFQAWLRKVRGGWTLVATAHNLWKLFRVQQRIRAVMATG